MKAHDALSADDDFIQLLFFFFTSLPPSSVVFTPNRRTSTTNWIIQIRCHWNSKHNIIIIVVRSLIIRAWPNMISNSPHIIRLTPSEPERKSRERNSNNIDDESMKLNYSTKSVSMFCIADGLIWSTVARENIPERRGNLINVFTFQCSLPWLPPSKCTNFWWSIIGSFVWVFVSAWTNPMARYLGYKRQQQKRPYFVKAEGRGWEAQKHKSLDGERSKIWKSRIFFGKLELLRFLLFFSSPRALINFSVPLYCHTPLPKKKTRKTIANRWNFDSIEFASPVSLLSLNPPGMASHYVCVCVCVGGALTQFSKLPMPPPERAQVNGEWIKCSTQPRDSWNYPWRSCANHPNMKFERHLALNINANASSP